MLEAPRLFLFSTDFFAKPIPLQTLLMNKQRGKDLGAHPPLLCPVQQLPGERAPWRDVGYMIGWLSILVGLEGVLYHLESERRASRMAEAGCRARVVIGMRVSTRSAAGEERRPSSDRYQG